jgi:hypothetical protein
VRDTGSEQRVDTGRRRPVVRARLERHVDGRAAGARAGRVQCDDLRVRPALALVPALSDDLVAGDTTCAHDRIGMRRAASMLGELERPLQEPSLHDADPTVAPTLPGCACRPPS